MVERYAHVARKHWKALRRGSMKDQGASPNELTP